MISRRALLAVPLAAPLAPVSVPARAVVPATQPISRLDTRWWRLRHEAKLAAKLGAHPELVWLGDSITQNFERNGPEPWARFAAVWERHYAPLRAFNLGFSGDATSHLLWRLQHGEVDGLAPKAAVILIGANNLGRLHWPAEDDIAGIEAVVTETRRRLPNTRILLLSVLPSDRTPWASETTLAINAGLARRFPAGGLVAFQDVTSVFVHGGALDHGLYFDPLLTPPEPALHPTADGMERLATAIAPTLASILRG